MARIIAQKILRGALARLRTIAPALLSAAFLAAVGQGLSRRWLYVLEPMVMSMSKGHWPPVPLPPVITKAKHT